jgi:hypothetical protein
MKTIASTDKDPKCHGLGQVIKDYIINYWWRFSFCSKFAIHVGPPTSFDGLYYLRDPVKMLKTKNYYHGNNMAI